MLYENEKKVYEILNNLQIPYIKYEHEPIFTIEEANKLSIDIKGQHCKNLFLRNRKGDKHYLLIIHEWKKVDIKSIAKQIESSSLSFASEERLYKYLGLTPGSVTPFGLINDSEKQVQVLLDNDLEGQNSISFHPNVNTATITISYVDFKEFLKWCGNNVKYVQV